MRTIGQLTLITALLLADISSAHALNCAETCALRDMWCAGETVGGPQPIFDCKAPDTNQRKQDISTLKSSLKARNMDEDLPPPVDTPESSEPLRYLNGLVGAAIITSPGGGTYL